MGLLDLEASRDQVLVHNPLKSAGDTLHSFAAVTITQLVFIENVVGRLGPSVIQNGLDLNFAAQASEPRIFGKSNSILAKPDRVVICTVLLPVVFRGGMVNFGRVLFNLEIFADQWRCPKALNVIVSVEDEPGTGKIAPIKFQRLCVEFICLG